MKVYTRRGKIQRVAFDTQAPVGPGGFCVRPTLAKAYQEHPFRLNYPLKRVGERGAGGWERISWNQAMDEIAEKLASISARHGAESVATSSGTGRNGAEFAKTRFMNLFGSPNRIGVISICYAPRAMVWFSTFGGHLVPDQKPGITKMVILWGRNAHEGGVSTWASFLKAQKAGLKTMVVDPRFVEPSRRADRWVQIKPGTDTALALGMMHIIIEEGLYDKDFVKKRTVGFTQLRKRTLEYPPERVSRITGLSIDALVETARFYAKNQPSNMVIGVASEHSAPNSIQAIRAINMLKALVGTVDVRGGELVCGPCPGFIPDVAMEANEMLSSEQRKKQLGSDRFRFLGYPGWELIDKQMRKVWGERHSAAVNLHSPAHAPTVFRAMISGKPYPVKAMLINCSNPLLSYANTKLVYKALKAAELLVTHEITWTPTAAISDYVLPAACWMERADMGSFATVGGYPLVQLGEAALPACVPGEYERWNDYDFWRALGLRLGQEQYWPWETFEQVWEYRTTELMEKEGAENLSDFIRKKRAVVVPPEPGQGENLPLATPSGKIELYSKIMEDLDYDPLPAYVEPSIPEAIKKKFPLINISGVRVIPYHHSEFRHVEEFRRRHPDPIVEIHFDVARKKGIFDGDWVTIETPLGKVEQRARLSNSFHPGYIVTQHSWWYPEKEPWEPSLFGLWESNINVTTDDDPEKCDPLSGAWPYKGQHMRCRIYKARSSDRNQTYPGKLP